ncbi:tail fiber assembly protein [Paraburkholderia bonniea]|uniref:tail fiber assembly protein n=1 Tax=Paraburkholderia bonniea TaxID=2152891 RepID=UPI001291FDAC|nr:tail fiber assembly protein [Paraburkholderia bonniea]
MLIHQYDSASGQYIGSCLADADPRNPERWLIPASSTTETPPERTSLSWPFYKNDAWLLLPDYRGRQLYKKSDGEHAEIFTPGVTPDECGLTDIPRPSEKYVWGEAGWAIDPEIEQQEKRAAAMTEFELRLDRARKQNAGKADAFAAGLLSDEEIYYFKAWASYQMALVAAIEKSTFPDAVDWPDTPAAYAPPPPVVDAPGDASDRTGSSS